MKSRTPLGCGNVFSDRTASPRSRFRYGASVPLVTSSGARRVRPVIEQVNAPVSTGWMFRGSGGLPVPMSSDFP